jgi:hypothetical protein
MDGARRWLVLPKTTDTPAAFRSEADQDRMPRHVFRDALDPARFRERPERAAALWLAKLRGSVNHVNI